MDKKRLIRILIGKPGLDGHDRGARVVAKALKEAGMEVIYTGLRQSVDSILNRAVKEKADVIGLSILSGSHLPICKELLEKMEQQGHKDIKVVVGGLIPREDIQALKDMGISEVFRQDSSFDEIIRIIEELAGRGKE